MRLKLVATVNAFLTVGFLDANTPRLGNRQPWLPLGASYRRKPCPESVSRWAAAFPACDCRESEERDLGCLLESREPHDARKAVEARVEAQDALDPMLFHDGEVQRVTRRAPPVAEDNLLRA